MEVSRSSLTFFQRNHDLKGPFAVQRIVVRYALIALYQMWRQISQSRPVYSASDNFTSCEFSGYIEVV